MRSFVGFLLFLCLTLSSSAQTVVQWASKVEAFSSELSEKVYGSAQALERPNVYPSGGDYPTAWMPYRNNRVEYIKVGFDIPMPIQQVAIFETFNPGAIRDVYLYDEKGEEYLVFQQKPAPIERESRVFRIFFEKTAYNVAAVKVVISGKEVDGYSAIDAIGISNSEAPIDVGINVVRNYNEEVNARRLSDLVNSYARENKPLLTRDKKTLYFSRRGHEDNMGGVDDLEDIWYSDFDELTGEWGIAKNIGAPLNNKGPNFISSFFMEEGGVEQIAIGNEYKDKGKDEKMKYGFSGSVRVGDSIWSTPEDKIILRDKNFDDNVNFWATPDKEVLIISEEEEDSKGDRDLYVSFHQKNGKWTEPMHMGDVINTAGVEEGPYLMPNKRTLFFTSNGHNGYGKKDIFMTRRLDDSWKSWTTPENVGPMINTEGDDTFLFLPLVGEKGYFSREVEEGDLDIFDFIMPLFDPIKLVRLCGKIIDPETKVPLEATVIFTRLSDGVEVGAVDTDEEGNYCIELPEDIYSYRAEVTGFPVIPAGTTIDIGSIDVDAVDLARIDVDAEFEPGVMESVEVPVIELNTTVFKAEVGRTFVIRNLFFDTDQHQLRPNSWIEIRNIAKFMNDYPLAKVELAGHTDNVGSEAYNMGLSERRAKAVVAALATLGVEEERMEIAWHGEEIPIASNRTAKGRLLNRRVEMTILEFPTPEPEPGEEEPDDR